MVFLPATIQRWAAYLPSSILMDTVKMAFTMEPDWRRLAACTGLLAAAWAFSGLMEVRRR